MQLLKRNVLVCCLVLSAFAATAWAQTDSARLVGTVMDQTGGVVPGVTVTATHVATNVSRQALTNDVGEYVIPILPPGIYLVRVELDGFKTEEREDLRLEVRQRARLDFSLAPGEITETVTVVGGSLLVDTETAEMGQVTGERMIKDLPLNGRDTFQLSRYTTGAVVERLVDNPNADPPMPSFNGQDPKSNLILLDGGDIADMNQRGKPAVRPIPDMIQEFKVVTNNYSAEYGRVAGAVITMVSKSGTNEFHGSVWDYVRNDALDANNFFANRSGIGKLPFKRHQFGGTFGGPILKDKTFFFFAYEGLRDRTARARSTVSPTANERQGIFGVDGSFPDRDIFDPFAVVDGQRMQFPNNTIPQSRFNPQSEAVLGSVFTPPLPNQPEGEFPNFFWGGAQKKDQEKVSVRVDHNFTNGSRLWGRWTWQDAPFSSDINVPNAVRLINNQRGQQFAAGWVKNFGATITNEVTLNLARKEILEAPGAPALGNFAETFGFDHAQLLPTEAEGVPRTRLSPYFEIRQSATEATAGTNGGISDIVSWYRGNHLLKFGFYHQRFKNITAIPGNAGGGFINFDGFATAQIGGGQGNPFADFLLGTPQRISLRTSFQIFKSYPSKSFYNWFIADDWKIKPNVTLTLGLRHEMSLPVVNSGAGAGFAFFDLGEDRDNPVIRFPKGANVEAILGGPLEGPNLSPLPARILDTKRITEPDYADFAPRIGIAWRPFGDNRTAVRIGYGISYDDTTFAFMNNTGRLTELAGTASGTQVRFEEPTLTYGVTPFRVEGEPASEFRGNFADPNWQPGSVQNWSLSIQREIMRETKVELAYVGNKGTHQFGARNFNVALPEGKQFQLPNSGTVFTATGTQVERRPYPAIRPNRYVISDMNTSYQALQARFERRFSDGLGLVTGYTWSKNLFTYQQRTAQNEYDRSGSRTLAPFHATQSFFVTSIFELPWTHGFTGVARQVLDGWEFTSLVTLQSGQPEMEIDAGSDVLNIGTRRVVLPNRTCDGNLSESQRTVNRYFDTSCFSPNPTDYGNSVAFPIFSDGIVNVDFGALKRFPFGETRFVEFRTEMFNVFNSVNFGPPRGSVTSSTFGRVTSTGMARQIQLALRIVF